MKPEVVEAAVHTSAHPLGEVACNDLVIEIQGFLIEDAVVCTKLVGADAHPLPVLSVDVKPLNGFKRTIHAGQIYSEATRDLAERKAATLKKGARITLTTTLHDMQIILPHVQVVTLRP